MSKYEAIYIIDAAMEETARNELIARFNGLIANNGGELEKIDEWGKRRLAYTIDYKNEGYYVLLHFSAGPDLPRELERNLQINENVLRYLIVKLDQKRSSVKPRAVPLRPAAPPPPIVPAGADAVSENAVETAPVVPESAEGTPETEVTSQSAEAAPESEATPESAEAAPESEAVPESAEVAPESDVDPESAEAVPESEAAPEKAEAAPSPSEE